MTPAAAAGSVDPNLVYGLYASAYRSHVLRVALELDVFTALAEGPTAPHDIAHAKGYDPHGVGALLDYLVGTNLVTTENGQYGLTETAARFLVRGRPTYAGEFILQHSSPEVWAAARDAIKGRRPAPPELRWEQDAWLDSYREDRPPEALAMWSAAGVDPGAAGSLRILDVACGCAIKSLALAQAHSRVHVTCVDAPEVLAVAVDLAGRMGVAERMTPQPGDVLDLQFDAAVFDAALVGQLTYYLTPDQNLALFERIAQLLKPGGVLVIDAIMTSEEPSLWASTVTLLALAGSDGRAYTAGEYTAWLTSAGFSEVHRTGDHWVIATR